MIRTGGDIKDMHKGPDKELEKSTTNHNDHQVLVAKSVMTPSESFTELHQVYTFKEMAREFTHPLVNSIPSTAKGSPRSEIHGKRPGPNHCHSVRLRSGAINTA